MIRTIRIIGQQRPGLRTVSVQTHIFQVGAPHPRVRADGFDVALLTLHKAVGSEFNIYFTHTHTCAYTCSVKVQEVGKHQQSINRKAEMDVHVSAHLLLDVSLV